MLYVPVSFFLGGSLTWDVAAIENDDGGYLMVPKQIDSLHKVLQVPQFFIAIWIQTKLHATCISCRKQIKTEKGKKFR